MSKMDGSGANGPGTNGPEANGPGCEWSGDERSWGERSGDERSGGERSLGRTVLGTNSPEANGPGANGPGGERSWGRTVRGRRVLRGKRSDPVRASAKNPIRKISSVYFIGSDIRSPFIIFLFLNPFGQKRTVACTRCLRMGAIKL